MPNLKGTLSTTKFWTPSTIWMWWSDGGFTWVPSVAPNWLLNNLVSYYEFEENVLDSHGSNNWTDNWTSDIAWKILRGRGFDGVNDYVNINSIVSGISSNTKWTISLWIEPDDNTPPSTETIFSIWDASWDFRLVIQVPTNWRIRTICTANGTAWNLQLDANPLTTWQYSLVTITQNGITPVIYINWVAPAQTFMTDNDRTKWFDDISWLDVSRIWCSNFNNNWNTEFFDWGIDEVWYWDKVLNTAEITALYNSTNWLAYSKFTT